MNRTRIVMLVFGVLLTALALLSGCASEPEPQVDESLMELTWREFDQTMGGGWRAIADRGDHNLVARTIEAYIERNPDIDPGEMVYLHFHCGQAWAIQHKYDQALGHFDQAYMEALPEKFPVSWNHMVGVTSAFFRDDREELVRIRTELSQMTNLAYRDSMVLEFFYELDDYGPDDYADLLLGE